MSSLYNHAGGAETCVARISKNGGYWDIRTYVTDHEIKPTSGTWFLLFGTSTSTIKLPTANGDITAHLASTRASKRLTSGCLLFRVPPQAPCRSAPAMSPARST